MKWIKASERLPEDENKKYFIRWKHRLTKDDEWEVLYSTPGSATDPKYWKLEWLDENPSLPEEGEGVRGNTFLLLKWLQENGWHWEEDSLVGDIWYQENDEGKSEVYNSNMLAEKYLASLPPAVGKEDEQEKLWEKLMQEWTDASVSNAKPNVLEYLKSKFTLIKK